MADNERLASVETKLEGLKELLIEVRDSLKELPTRVEYDILAKRIDNIEKEHKEIKDNNTKLIIKVGIIFGIIGIIAGWLIKFAT